MTLDHRTHAFRRDLADIALAGQFFAPHYAEPLPMTGGGKAEYVRSAPANGAEIVCDFCPGQTFAVLEISGGWAWGYRCDGHHVGYVHASHLSEMN